MRPTWVSAVALTAAFAGVCAAAGVVKAPSHTPSARTAPIIGSTLVCPDLENVNGDEVATTLTAGTSVLGTGKTEIYGIDRSREPRQTLLDHGPAVKRYISKTSGPVVVQSSGAITGGVVATQLSRGRKTNDRGYAETACTPPLTEQWFVGASTTVGASPYLQLVNVESFAALVNITIYSPDGVISNPAGQGLVVQGRRALRVDLDTLAPDEKMTAVEVTTLTGRVAAAVRDTHIRGLTELGTDWVPLARTPQPDVVIPGIPPDGGTNNPPLSSVRLAVANPNQSDTTIKVQAIASDGFYVPSGLDSVLLRAGTLKILDLGKALQGAAAAIEVTSSDTSLPIVAGVSVDAKSTVTDVHELMFLGAQSTLTGDTYLPEIRVAPDVYSTLLISAPQTSVSATLQLNGDLRNGLRDQTVRLPSVPAGRTVSLDLGKYVKGLATALITPDPGSGPLYAVRYLYERGARGPLISALAPVNSQPPVEVPPVSRSLDVWQLR